MIIAVDFDGVVMDPNNVPEGFRMGNPKEGAKDSLEKMRKDGHTIVIFSYRAKHPKHIAEWMEFFEIPYDEITNIKGDFDLIIDDKAVKFTTWEEVKGEL